MPGITISELNIYPVKGCRAISVQEAVVRETGETFSHQVALQMGKGKICTVDLSGDAYSAPAAPPGFLFDRHWLAVTADSGRFFSQRNEAKLALVQPSIHPAKLLSVPGAPIPADAALTVTAPGMDPLTVSPSRAEAPHFTSCMATAVLGLAVHAVHMHVTILWGLAPSVMHACGGLSHSHCLQVPLAPPKDASLEERQVVCWEWKGMARDQGDAAAAWFTAVLGKPTRLVRFLGEHGFAH